MWFCRCSVPRLCPAPNHGGLRAMLPQSERWLALLLPDLPSSHSTVQPFSRVRDGTTHTRIIVSPLAAHISPNPAGYRHCQVHPRNCLPALRCNSCRLTDRPAGEGSTQGQAPGRQEAADSGHARRGEAVGLRAAQDG